MQVRITIPALQYGNVQWTRGQIAVVPDELGSAFITRKEAVAVPIAEQATLPRPENAAVVPRPGPRPAGKPKPKFVKGGRRP
jgi:hypothetical protein